jgi:predicted nucleic acid-binding Zn ribbon protein
MSIVFWKHCILCGEAFDIGINYDICPECRKKEAENG